MTNERQNFTGNIWWRIKKGSNFTIFFLRQLPLSTEEVHANAPHLAAEILPLRLVHEQKPDMDVNYKSPLSPHQERRDYIPNVFRGINTTGSSLVYEEFSVPTGLLEGSHKVGDLPRGGALLSLKQCSHIANTNMAHVQAPTIKSHPVPCHVSYPTPVLRAAGADGSLKKRPGSPSEEDGGVQHPHAGCLRLSTGLIKGVICSPQSPLRSDCQPNSPTESNSSKNATLSLKQHSDCPKEAKARNWKKYKLIIMNQPPEEKEKEKEAQGGATETTATSPTPRVLADVQAEEGAGELREEVLMGQCCSSTCSSLR